MLELKHVSTNYPEHQRLYEEAMDFYEGQLNKLSGVEGQDYDEIIFKLIMLKFCVIAKQCLKSLHELLQQRDFFTPLTILRNMIEYAIDAAYIEKRPRKRARQYAAQGIKQQLTLIKSAKRHPTYLGPELKEVVDREEELNAESKNLRAEIDAWKKTLEQRAIDAGIPHIYDFHYRLLSINTHPSSTTSNEFFTETPDKMIVVHNYKKDTTTMALATALEITNTLMSRVDEHFNQGMSDMYDSFREKIDNLPR